ncbi:MAG TPA: hypothetical protein VEB42_12690 [Chitinophagaceae bacterium]|nr:hypothetical protein [Chitinophagaceae bacterium]
MKREMEVISRLTELQSMVRMLEDKRREELSKPCDQRDYRLIRFLNREFSVYEFSVAQLQWLLS